MLRGKEDLKVNLIELSMLDRSRSQLEFPALPPKKITDNTCYLYFKERVKTKIPKNKKRNVRKRTKRQRPKFD